MEAWIMTWYIYDQDWWPEPIPEGHCLQLLKSQQSQTPVYEDNTAFIEWGNNIIGGRERAKHIDIRKHFAHEAIQIGKMLLVRVPTSS